MISPYQGDAVRIADFKAEEEEKGFEAVETAVYEVAHKEVICVGDVAADAEELHQVMELPVYVSAYCYWCVDLDDVAFFDEKFAGFVAELADGRFGDCFACAEGGY